MEIDEIDPWNGSPMTENSIFDVFFFERLSQKKVIFEVQLCGTDIVGEAEEFLLGFDVV